MPFSWRYPSIPSETSKTSWNHINQEMGNTHGQISFGP